MKKTVYDINLESAFNKCLIIIGIKLSSLVRIKHDLNLFFFFPYYHVGGAEKVHAEIVRCFEEHRPWVFFTHQSKDSKFRHLFGRRARLFDVWWLFKYTLPFSVGFVAGVINRCNSPVVFGCSSRFFYKMLPFLKPEVRRIDLLHAFGGGGEDFSLSAVPYLDVRVIINRNTAKDFEAQYRSHRIDPKFLERIVLIENRLDVPEQCAVKDSPPLQVLYVGRGSEEKRVHLAGMLATLASERGLAADFLFAGDVVEAVHPEDRPNCTFFGEIKDAARLADIYRGAHVLVLCSSREGFPVVIMEAMANGVVPVSTSVGGIPEHVKDGQNGILITETEESEIVSRMAGVLEQFVTDPSTLKSMSLAAHDYAKYRFEGRDFCKKYHELFFGPAAKGDS